MKKKNFKFQRVLKAGLMIALISFISSCDWIDPEINVDPDAPGDVPMNLLVPGIQQSIGFSIMGNDGVRPVNIWMQLYDGVVRQSFTTTRYQLTSADTDNYWASLYTDALINSQILLDKAIAEESPHNAGLAKVLLAYTYEIASDLFGDIPLSEALMGSENNLVPIYDAQQDVYTSIMTMLDEGINDLSSAEETVGIGGDVIYDGDVDKWIMAAYAIKARAALQLSKVNGASAYTAALAAVDMAFTSNADNMEVPWEISNPNPMNQFMVERGDVRMCQTFLDELEATGDPRISALFGPDDAGEISGSTPASANEAASPPGDYLAAPEAPTVLASFVEMKFIEAEAALSTDPARAVEAYKAGVAASLRQIAGEADADWLAANVDGETAGTITLEKIIMAKRIALVGQIQPFSDWRRTGIPALTLAPDATKTEIPRRFPYSQGEIIYNPDNVPSIGSIIVPVWWDE